MTTTRKWWLQVWNYMATIRPTRIFGWPAMFYQISKKLNQLMESEKISGLQLAKKLDIPPSTIKKIRSQEITNPTMSTLVPIAKYFGVPLEYFLFDSVEIDLSTKTSRLPLLRLNEITTDITAIKNKNYILLHRKYNEGSYILSIEEICMPLAIEKGYLVVDPHVTARNGDLVIIISNKKSIPPYMAKLTSESSSLRLLLFDGSKKLVSIKNQIHGVIIEYFRDLVLDNKE